ncbi:MAG: hypothetical protein A2096_14820 [Spirochaetes bacterium GWF1_41_5]|nr:MAG: hypothetical protein A2096_14820 [Spirochaetes bacterium GWF1_41_5]HBE03420.1 hypothetical protein [Spirochaetia bacterium]
MSKDISDGRQRVIKAAIELFAKKGKHGTRMEEVGKHAKINKAMVYYYFNTKDNLYQEILMKIVIDMFRKINQDINSIIKNKMNFTEILRQLIAIHFNNLSRNPQFIQIMIDALANEPEKFKEVMKIVKNNPDINANTKAIAILKEGMNNKIIRKDDPKQILISIIGMNLIYFIAKQIADVFLDIDIKNEQDFLIKRKKSVLDLIMYGILEKKE